MFKMCKDIEILFISTRNMWHNSYWQLIVWNAIRCQVYNWQGREMSHLLPPASCLLSPPWMEVRAAWSPGPSQSVWYQYECQFNFKLNRTELIYSPFKSLNRTLIYENKHISGKVSFNHHKLVAHLLRKLGSASSSIISSTVAWYNQMTIFKINQNDFLMTVTLSTLLKQSKTFF